MHSTHGESDGGGGGGTWHFMRELWRHSRRRLPPATPQPSSISAASSAQVDDGLAGTVTDKEKAATLRQTAAERVTVYGMLINLVLGLGQGACGLSCHSTAVLADAAHSLSDMLSDLITLASVRISGQPADECHQYGHGKYESLGSMFVSSMLLATGAGMATHSFQHVLLVLEGGGASSSGSLLALGAVVASLLAKESMYQMTKRVAERNNSSVLLANAWHHRSDAISSAVALLGVTGAHLGVPILDPVAGLCVSLLIVRMGSNLLFDSLRELTDQSHHEANHAAHRALKSVRESIVGHLPIRTRRMGPNALVDLRIFVDPNMPVSSAHQIAEHLRTYIMQEEPTVTDVLVHVTPPGWDPDSDSDSVEELPRPYTAVERDVRSCLQRLGSEAVVDGVRCHYDERRIVVDVEVRTPPAYSASQCEQMAGEMRRLILAEVPDVFGVRVLVDYTFGIHKREKKSQTRASQQVALARSSPQEE
eukprot:CAMPEP_0177634996 /NCGR_PEP_ID=MMETSP0447-20121125/3664_1 /TAXON_ID=0 /ORGANISM="Stygamoeba regulata, Strain BSH-02190019" /LENGTH=478 /DNA_ID=CAMNT_0019136751 /DNA_START=231 /DNA_END=1667 /DNA_ORIENTATION=-